MFKLQISPKSQNFNGLNFLTVKLGINPLHFKMNFTSKFICCCNMFRHWPQIKNVNIHRIMVGWILNRNFEKVWLSEYKRESSQKFASLATNASSLYLPQYIPSISCMHARFILFHACWIPHISCVLNSFYIMHAHDNLTGKLGKFVQYEIKDFCLCRPGFYVPDISDYSLICSSCTRTGKWQISGTVK